MEPEDVLSDVDWANKKELIRIDLTVFAHEESCAAVDCSQSHFAKNQSCVLGQSLHANFLPFALTLRSLLMKKVVHIDKLVK